MSERTVAPPELVDPNTPPDVQVTLEARAPTWDPTLGITLPPAAPPAQAAHRLVTLGDSLTHGFQSGAIFNTDLSFPMIIAWELGWDDAFRHPRYPGHGGLPVNIEYLLRALEERYGDKLDWWELAPALFRLRQVMDQIEDYWERGPGARPPNRTGINHNLAVYGWDLRDTLVRTADTCAAAIRAPKDQLLTQIVENANERAAIRVLDAARHATGRALTPLGAAHALGEDGGIETLIVLLGANNALRAVTELRVVWSDRGYDDPEQKHRYTVWRPTHFQAELDRVVAEVTAIQARHVIWGTVPHVTIAPIARGVGQKVRRGSRYYPYYTRPWISDTDFDAKDDPHITEREARAVDSAIDQYNDAIEGAVRAARTAGRDWYLLDVAGYLDRLAARRYIDDPQARPPWWTPYDLPPELAALRPPPDSRFFVSGPEGRVRGGLFSLDGVHPTTIAYGLLAQEFIAVMQRAGVVFTYGDGRTPRVGPVRVDFRRLIRRDTLIADPPRSLAADLGILGWLDETADLFGRMLRLSPAR